MSVNSFLVPGVDLNCNIKNSVRSHALVKTVTLNRSFQKDAENSGENIYSLKCSFLTFTGLNKGTYERNSLGWYKSHSLSHIGSGSRDIRTVHVSVAICYNKVLHVPHSTLRSYKLYHHSCHAAKSRNYSNLLKGVGLSSTEIKDTNRGHKVKVVSKDTKLKIQEVTLTPCEKPA